MPVDITIPSPGESVTEVESAEPPQRRPPADIPPLEVWR